MAAAGLARVVRVTMFEWRSWAAPDFFPEALHRVRLRGQVRGHHLERHDSAHDLVFGLVDHTHPARAEFAEDLVARVIGQRFRNRIGKGRLVERGCAGRRGPRRGAGEVGEAVFGELLEQCETGRAGGHVIRHGRKFGLRQIPPQERGQSFGCRVSLDGHRQAPDERDGVFVFTRMMA